MLSPYSAMNCSSVIFFFESKYFQIAAVISAMMEPANEVIERSALCGNSYSNEKEEAIRNSLVNERRAVC